MLNFLQENRKSGHRKEVAYDGKLKRVITSSKGRNGCR